VKKRKFFVEYNAPVILTVSLICLIALGLGMYTGNVSTKLFFMTYNSGWFNPMTYVRMFTYVFGHANWEHFLGNIMYILILGPMIEEKYGSKKLIKMIAITAGVGGLANNIIFPRVMLCGASGIVFMMIILASATSFETGQIPLTLILVLVIYLGGEIYDALYVDDNVSQLAHIAGGICGAVFGLYNVSYHREPI
jgi:GlpG protein